MRTAVRAWLVLLALVVAGCTGAPPPETGMPSLMLPPAALGASLALQQRLTVTVRGRVEQVDAILEADASSVRLALLVFGRVGARLEWDGAHLQAERAPGWPEAVSAQRVLSDLQLVYWPASAIRGVLPSDWSLDVRDGRRVLARSGRSVIEVSYREDHIDLRNVQDGYVIRIESRTFGAQTS